MINLLKRIQDISKNLNVLLSIIIIINVIILHTMSTPQIETFSFFDKFSHVVIFYITGLWFFLIFRQDYWLILMTLLCILALSMEFLQMNLSYRSFEWFDWVADVLGLLLSFFHLSKKL